jgi:hypothetical protein
MTFCLSGEGGRQGSILCCIHKVGPLHFKVGDALYRSDLRLSIRKFGHKKHKIDPAFGNLVAVVAV